MREQAFWTVEFMANNEAFGAGVVTMMNNKVFGGDVSFTYIGSYELDNDKNLNINLTIESFNKIQDAVFPGLDNYELNLKGKYSENEFTLIGSPKEYPELKLAVNCKRRAEIL